MENNEGGPAFPQPCTENGYAANTPYGMAGGGMSMRDYFAAKAMQGFLANPNQDYAPMVQKNLDAVVSDAYKIADAMLQTRNA